MNSSINELTHQFSSEQPRPPDVPAVQVFDAWNLRILQADEFSALGQSRDHLSRNQLLYFDSVWTAGTNQSQHSSSTVPSSLGHRSTCYLDGPTPRVAAVRRAGPPGHYQLRLCCRKPFNRGGGLRVARHHARCPS